MPKSSEMPAEEQKCDDACEAWQEGGRKTHTKQTTFASTYQKRLERLLPL